MNQKVKLACWLIILASATACASSAVTPEPTRTPKPTFTPVANTPTSRLSSPVSVSTTTLYSTATPGSASTAYPTTEPGSTGTAHPTAAARPTGTAYPTAAARPTDTAIPMDTAVPTDTPAPTDTPVPTATTPACAQAYDLYTDPQLGFSACYPSGWAISQHEDQAHEMKEVSFASPAMDVNTGAEFRVTSVRILPGITGTEEQILKTIAKQLIETYDKLLQGWPSQVIVDGQKGVEAKYEGAVAFGQELVNIVGWEAVIVKGGKQWVLTVVGRTEYREELESIHSQFRLRFHVLPSP